MSLASQVDDMRDASQRGPIACMRQWCGDNRSIKGAVTTASASPHLLSVRCIVYAGLTWSIILYADGITPGAVLAPDNRRKAICWYSSFLEMRTRLTNEEAWVTVALARTKWIKSVDGGVSKLTRLVMRSMFLGDVAANGVVLPIGEGGGMVTVRWRFAALLADEEALNAMTFIKGAGGICPCALLCCVTNKQRPTDVAEGVRALTDIDPNVKDISCPDVNLCGLRKDEDVWRLCDRLSVCDKNTELPELEHCTGLKWNPNTLLFDLELRSHFRPSSHTVFDVMHILFSNGLVGSEIMRFMKRMKSEVGAYFHEVRQYSAEKGWKPERIQEAISPTREASAHDTLKAGASELLSVYPLLRAFILATYGADATEGFVISILTLFQICDLVWLLMRTNSPTRAEAAARRLDTLCRKYMTAFVAAYGRDAVRFKHHMLLHVASQVFKLKKLLSCWVTERKNLHLKLCLQSAKNHGAVTVNAMSRMLNMQVLALETPGWRDFLVDPVEPYPELASSLGAQRVGISRSMRWHQCSLSCNDIVFLDLDRTCMVVVVGCVGIDDSFGLLIRWCERASATDTTSLWHVHPDVGLQRLAEEVLVPVALFRFLSPGVLEVLH